MNQIVGGIAWQTVHVLKADQIGKGSIAKENSNAVPGIGVIQTSSIVQAQINAGLRKNAFVRCHPLESEGRRHLRDVIRNGSLRWPQPVRLPAESLLHEIPSASQLLTCVRGETNV